jgi:hypothetical protein
MSMVKSVGYNSGCEATWMSKDALSGFVSLVVWKVSKDVPIRSKYGILYQWAVKSPLGGFKARGYARKFSQAVRKAEKARAYILEQGVQTFNPPDYLSENLENVLAE